MSQTYTHPFQHLHRFLVSHDDLPAFHAIYWTLTFLVALLFNAGAFAVLVLLHMALDVFKYGYVHGMKPAKIVEGVVRENVLDVALLFLSITFAVYCNASLPVIAGLQGLARGELTVFRSMVGLGTNTTILHHFLSVLANIHKYLAHVHPLFGGKWSLLERLSIVSIVIALALIALAPSLLSLSWSTYGDMLGSILIPGTI
jgi:hypothetical protein